MRICTSESGKQDEASKGKVSIHDKGRSGRIGGERVGGNGEKVWRRRKKKEKRIPLSSVLYTLLAMNTTRRGRTQHGTTSESKKRFWSAVFLSSAIQSGKKREKEKEKKWRKVKVKRQDTLRYAKASSRRLNLGPSLGDATTTLLVVQIFNPPFPKFVRQLFRHSLLDHAGYIVVSGNSRTKKQKSCILLICIGNGEKENERKPQLECQVEP